MKNLFHYFCIALIIAGVVMILGTAGRADTTDAAFSTLASQLSVSCGIVLAGLVGEAVLAKK